MFKLNYSKLTGSANKARISGSGSSTFVLPTNYESKLLEDMIGSDNKLTLNSLYREIYLYDNVSGPAVDLMSTLPWSDCVISGVTDPAVIRIYEDTLSELNIHALMIQLSVSYLVLGTVIGSLIFNEQKGIFTDLSIHDPDYCNISPIPLKGYDPKIDLKVSKEMKKFLRSRDPRDKEALKEIPNELYVKLLRQDTIQLEPLNTIYLSRSSVPGINNISYYTRILPIWLIEKALMRGTIIGAWRRQRGITHITCLSGDTLISTEKGNVRLDKIVPHNPDEFNDITVSYPLNLKVQGIDGNFYLSTFWHYRGVKETITITTEKGRSLSCTSDHRILTVIDDNLQLICASELLNKHICIVSEKSKSKDKVVNIKVNNKEPVYDLTMSSETSPVFIANNIVVHNCGTEEWEPTDDQLDAVTSMFINADQDPMGAVLTTRAGIDIQTASSGNDFWRVSDDWDVFTTAKMRALSINDEFLGGAANFSTAEVALSSFMETQKAFRDFMTTNIIYNKIFLMLSKYHEIRKLTSAQLDHRIRIEGSKTQVIGQKNLSSANKYLIPTLHWMKDLSPKMDSAYLDTISAVSEKGVPIPLALFASAAGLNINNVLDALEQDIEHRNAIAEYKAKLKPAKKGGGGGGSEESEEMNDDEGDMEEGMDEYGEEMTGNIPPELVLTPKQASNILQLNAQKLSKAESWRK